MASPKDYGSYARVIDPFVFYGSYHAHPMNQLVHVFFVPSILVTSFVFLNYADLTGWIPPSVAGLVTPFIGPLSLDVLAAFYYMGVYAYLSPNALGFSAAGLVLLGLVSAQAFVAGWGSSAWVPALILHIVSWILQVHVGHTIYEKRAPALLDNLYQALVMAPFFVYCEVLMYLGLVPRLKRIVTPLVAKAISKFLHERDAAAEDSLEARPAPTSSGKGSRKKA